MKSRLWLVFAVIFCLLLGLADYGFAQYTKITITSINKVITNYAPLFGPLSSLQVVKGRTRSILIRAYDDSTDRLILKVSGLTESKGSRATEPPLELKVVFDKPGLIVAILKINTTNINPGLYNILLEASDDKQGLTKASIPLTIISCDKQPFCRVFHAPVLDPLRPQEVVKGQALKVKVGAWAGNFGSLEKGILTVDLAKSQLEITKRTPNRIEGIVTWQAPSQSGRFVMTVTAKDKNGLYSVVQVPIMIKDIALPSGAVAPAAATAIGEPTTPHLVWVNPQPPYGKGVSEVPSFEVREGEFLEINNVLANAECDCIVAYDVFNLPQGAGFDELSRQFWFGPNFSQGRNEPYEVTLRATDTCSGISATAPPPHNERITADNTFTIKVINVSDPPKIDPPIGSRTVVIGSSLEFDIQASDPDNDVLSFTAEKLPAGATLNSASGRFSWTPTKKQIGSHRVKFKVSDGRFEVSEEVTIEVRAGIIGKIAYSGKEHVPVAGCTVELRDKDSNRLIEKKVTDAKGMFEFSPPLGKYKVVPLLLSGIRRFSPSKSMVTITKNTKTSKTVHITAHRR